MKTILLALCLLTGCADSPESLKARDKHEEECQSQCAPRKMRAYDNWIGCHCADEKAK